MYSMPNAVYISKRFTFVLVKCSHIKLVPVFMDPGSES